MSVPHVPLKLRIVAWVFLIVGLNAAHDFILCIVKHGGLPPGEDLGLLGIPVYFGLVRLWPGWRTCALILLGLYFVAWSIVSAFVLVQHKVGTFILFGCRLIEFPFPRSALYLGASLALAIWEVWVLTRPDIVALLPNGAARRKSIPSIA
jgi:hypothetical protein